MADIGYIALVIAFVVAIYSVIASIFGIRKQHEGLTTSARNGIYAIFALFTLSLAVMVHALVTKDYGIELVYRAVNEDQSMIYTVAGLYADKAGSLMLWGWLISLFAAILVFQKRRSHKEIMSYTLPILAIVVGFWVMLVTFAGNVFEKSPHTYVDGIGMKAINQNPGILVHPPLIYLGFAAFAIVFAFALGALLSRSSDSVWIMGIRRWTLFAWCALGLGNLVGAWWAYNELSWGGFWAWDPVENASLMPWLLGTAFLHSISIQRRKSYLRKWSLLLIIFVFIFSLISPFITHGGITSDLHGFGGTPFVPYFGFAILATLIVTLAISASRRDELHDEDKPVSFVSREGAFILANIVLVVITLLTFVGTTFPKLADLLGRNMALERTFFDWSCGPILLVMLFIMGLCPVLGWRKASSRVLKRDLLYPLVAAVIIAIVILILGIGNWYAVAALVCGFPMLTILLEWFRGMRARHRSKGQNYPQAFVSLIWGNRPRYGGFVAHIGVLLIALGVLGASFYRVEGGGNLVPGQDVNVGAYTLTYEEATITHSPEDWNSITYFMQQGYDYATIMESLYPEEDPDKWLADGHNVATVSVYRGGDRVCTLHPEYDYISREQGFLGEASVHTTVAEDLFVSMDWVWPDSRARFRVLINPLIVWMWIGGGFLLLGGLVAFWPDRKRAYADRAHRIRELLIREDIACSVVKETDLDYEMGRLSEEEYRNISDTYNSKIKSLRRQISKTEAPLRAPDSGQEIDDEIERQVMKLRQSEKQQVKAKARFCPQCGAKQQIGARFCSRCGARQPKG